MINSIDTEKAFNKTSFHAKTLSKLGVEESFLNTVKAIYEEPNTEWGKVRGISAKIQNQVRLSTLTIAIQYTPEILSRVTHWKGRSQFMPVCRL